MLLIPMRCTYIDNGNVKRQLGHLNIFQTSSLLSVFIDKFVHGLKIKLASKIQD